MAQECSAVLRRERSPRTAGRPTKYRPWMCDKIIRLGETGMEVLELAIALGVGQATLYRWSEQHAEFREAFTRAREASEVFHLRNIRRQLQMPARHSNVSAYLNYMARRFPSWRQSPATNPNFQVSISESLERARRRALALRSG